MSRRKFPASGDLQLLNEALAQTPLRLEVRGEKDQFLCERKAGGTKFAKLLGPVVWSAAELLTSGKIDQVKCCASETCGWLFLDNTKIIVGVGAIWPIAGATQRRSAITAKNYRFPCELKRAAIRIEKLFEDERDFLVRTSLEIQAEAAPTDAGTDNFLKRLHLPFILCPHGEIDCSSFFRPGCPTSRDGERSVAAIRDGGEPICGRRYIRFFDRSSASGEAWTVHGRYWDSSRNVAIGGHVAIGGQVKC